MSDLTIARLILLTIGLVAIGLDIWRSRRNTQPQSTARWLLWLIALLSIVGISYLVLRQFTFPLHLDLMEGTVLQHFERASNFQPIYPSPTPEFIPLAYNPGYYVLSIPFGWIFGVNLFTLRLVALLGMIGSGAVIGAAVWQHTKSSWWALIAVGLFAAAYWVMDAYLNTAHSDSWFIFSGLLGSYIIHQDRSRTWNIIGVMLLVAAFWFKQHGAWLTIGGVLYLTWQESQKTSWQTGIIRSWPYWATAIILGPATYFLLGPKYLGTEFIYFTFDVPRGWSELTTALFIRFGSFVLRNYLLLALLSGFAVLWVIIKRLKHLTIWHVQAVFAATAGLMGAFDGGSSNNVFIPVGVLFIVLGTQALYSFSEHLRLVKTYRLHLAALYVSFSLFMFNPSPFITSTQANTTYDDFVDTLQDLDGPIYAPWQAYMKEEINLYPAAHWVALDDIIRGPGVNTSNHPEIQKYLEPLTSPDDTAYILTNKPLQDGDMLAFLLEDYVLEQDFEDRFTPIGLPPKRFDHGHPRYLYRYDPDAAEIASN